MVRQLIVGLSGVWIAVCGGWPVSSDQWPACPGSEAIITSSSNQVTVLLGARNPKTLILFFHSKPLYSHVPHPTRRWEPESGVWVSRIARVKRKTIQTLNIRRISFIFWFTPLCSLFSLRFLWSRDYRAFRQISYERKIFRCEQSSSHPVTHTCALLDGNPTLWRLTNDSEGGPTLTLSRPTQWFLSRHL